jgi:two-component system response regulator YesN
MYSVFLVDDEPIVLEGIRTKIDWESAGFTFAGEATDGEIALSMIHEIKPDILITDIKMPFMDGLELSRLVKKEMPGIRIVVLSGYDDFNYAREAISIGVEEYILKPVSEESLMEELRKLADSVRAERRDDEAKIKYMRDREEIRMLEQQKFLHDMIGGKLSIQDSLTLGKELGIDIAAEFYSVVLMHVFSGKGENNIDAYSVTKEEIYSRVKAIYNDVDNVYLYEQVGDTYVRKAKWTVPFEQG